VASQEKEESSPEKEGEEEPRNKSKLEKET
jgi:hypothetical protein